MALSLLVSIRKHFLKELDADGIEFEERCCFEMCGTFIDEAELHIERLIDGE